MIRLRLISVYPESIELEKPIKIPALLSCTLLPSACNAGYEPRYYYTNISNWPGAVVATSVT